MQISLLWSFTFLAFALRQITSISLGEEAQFDQDNFEAFKHFGDNVKLLDLEQKPVALSLSLNANLENSFEHNLIVPKQEDYSQFTPSIASHLGVRYTTTPVRTYKVREEVYEPKPIPQVVPIPGKPPLILGSGSLGITNLGHGKYALGSGSLGYSRPVTSQQTKKEPEDGGLHVVPSPSLGSTEAFDADFKSFDFKTLHHFFGDN